MERTKTRKRVKALMDMNRIHKVNTSFARIWHSNPFLTGSLQSMTTLPATSKRRAFLSPFFSRAAISRTETSLLLPKLGKFLLQLGHADGSVVNFDDNACVLINKTGEPIGSRLNGVVGAELRDKKWSKILSLAPMHL